MLADLVGVPFRGRKGEVLGPEDRDAVAIWVTDLARQTFDDRWDDPQRFVTDDKPAAIPMWLAYGVMEDALRAGEGRPRLVLVSKEVAGAFIEKHHSELPYINPRGLMYAIGVQVDDRLVAVATASTPTGRWDRSDRVSPHNVVEVTRIASDGTYKGAASMLMARFIDLLPRSLRGDPNAPYLLVTYSLAGEKASVYKALRDKGLRPVEYRPPKPAQGEGSARSETHTPRADAGKIRWEAGTAALPADWSLLDRTE